MRIRISGSSDICASEFGFDDLPSYAQRMATNLAERIAQLRSLRRLDQKQFAEALGVSQGTVSRWEKGAKPKPEMLQAIANFAGIPVDTLLGVAPPPIEVEAHEVRWVPLIGFGPASSWREAITMPMGDVAVKASKAGRRAFAVEIKGDSMDKLLPEGGWAVVDPDQTNFYDNKVYLVANDEHEVTVKRYKGNPARLEPMSHNPSHETLMIVPHKVNVIGRIVAHGGDDGL